MQPLESLKTAKVQKPKSTDLFKKILVHPVPVKVEEKKK